MQVFKQVISNEIQLFTLSGMACMIWHSELADHPYSVTCLKIYLFKEENSTHPNKYFKRKV